MSQTVVAAQPVGRPSKWRVRGLGIRLPLTAVALAIWFWTQSLIGARGLSVSGINDRLQTALALGNSYLQTHLLATNVLLIVSSGVVDLLGIFLLARWILGGSLRPFLALVIVLGLRRSCSGW